MTPRRLLFGALVALATTGALAACGGSSSETPPPLQPDPAGFRYAPAATSVRDTEDSDAGDGLPNSPESSDDPNLKPRVPARATPGSTPAAH